MILLDGPCITHDEVFADLLWQAEPDVLTLVSRDLGHTLLQVVRRGLGDLGDPNAPLLRFGPAGDLGHLE